MNCSDLAKNISTTLSMGIWSEDWLTSRLHQRLPGNTHSLIPALQSVLLSRFTKKYAPSSNSIAKALLDSEEFAKVWNYCNKHNIWPELDLSTPKMVPIEEFDSFALPEIPTLDALAKWLTLSPDQLDYLADIHGRYGAHNDYPVHHYHYILREKKFKGVRIIEAPKKNLKCIQTKILRCIIDEIPPNPDSFGFTKGRNCIQAANRHGAEEVVISFDLNNFFHPFPGKEFLDYSDVWDIQIPLQRI